MNLNLILVLFILYILPLSGCVLLLYWGLKKYGRERLAFRLRKYLFILLGVGFIAVNMVDWILSHHSVSIELEGRYEIDLEFHELDSFQDWPVDIEIQVFDREAMKQVEFECQGEGPFYQILINNKDEIWFKGYYSNSGYDWIADLGTQNVFSGEPKDTSEFLLKAEIRSNFEIVAK